MGAVSRDFYLYHCGNCEELHRTPHREAEAKKQWTRISELPRSNHPWIMVRYNDVIICANEEWSPFILHPDGRIEPLEAHLPSEMRG